MFPPFSSSPKTFLPRRSEQRRREVTCYMLVSHESGFAFCVPRGGNRGRSGGGARSRGREVVVHQCEERHIHIYLLNTDYRHNYMIRTRALSFFFYSPFLGVFMYRSPLSVACSRGGHAFFFFSSSPCPMSLASCFCWLFRLAVLTGCFDWLFWLAVLAVLAGCFS